MSDALHKPVLLNEVIAALLPEGRVQDTSNPGGAIFVDGTFGAGGYTRALLEAANCTVFAIDRDPDAVKGAQPLLARYPDRLHVIQGRFGDLARLLEDRGVAQVQGITFDFGVSSMQLDQAARGFSFRFSGPLDMRMEQAGQSAAEIVNAMAEQPLADLIFTFGEERQSRRIARAIVAARDLAPIETTDRLAEIVRRAIGGKPNPQAIDPATRTFQALRIAVNDELGEIDRGLAAAERLLSPGGRLAVVSFHSLEDRRVKQFLRDRAGAAPKGSRHLPPLDVRGQTNERAPAFRLIAAGGVTASDAELRSNPRARSARLRIAERTDAPVSEAA